MDLRLPPPIPALAIAVLLTAILGAWAAGPAPAVPIALASEHEGGGAVTLAGTVTDLRGGDGRTRFTLSDGGYALPVTAPEASVQPGQRVEATGRLARLGGALTLLVGHASDLVATTPAQAESPGWDAVARDPSAWRDQPFWLAGTADATTLRDGAGHKVQLGHGEWLRGPIRALGVLRYDPACLCERLDAAEVQAWKD